MVIIVKNDDFLDLVGKIDSEFIESAGKVRKKKNRRAIFIKTTAIAACICLLVTGTFIISTDNAFKNYIISDNKTTTAASDNETYPFILEGELESSKEGLASTIDDYNFFDKYKAFTVSPAVYPERPKYVDLSYSYEELSNNELDKLYDEWFESKSEIRQLANNVTDSVNEFTKKTAKEFISTNNEEENLIYSPLNVYFALSMLSETTSGNSQKQILKLLGMNSLESLRTEVNNLWNLNYCDDGYTTSVFANSVWLNENVKFNKATLDNLADNYYASSFSGDVTDSEFSKAYQDWLNSQTGGLLKDYVQDEKFDDNTVMTLASTVYYKVSWLDEFYKENTKKDIFYKSDSSEIQCDFMNSTRTGEYYWGENFSCISKSFTDGGSMKFILPKKGVSINKLLSNKEVMNIISSQKMPDNSKYALINLSVPKFDVSSNLKISEKLENLGMKDVFNSARADFSNLTEEKRNDIVVSNISHAGRVKIDEEGCEAAAYTSIYTGFTSAPTENIDFVLNRPFIFVITGEGGQTLFVGVVNNP